MTEGKYIFVLAQVNQVRLSAHVTSLDGGLFSFFGFLNIGASGNVCVN